MQQKLLVTFKGRDNLSSSDISHFIQQTDINYIKLITIEKICNLIMNGENPNNFVVASKSIDLFKDKSVEYDDFKNYIILAKKEDSAEKFWNVINRHHRPVVFYRTENGFIPIFQYYDENSLILRKLEVNSPIEMNFEGAGKVIPDLFYASEREQRDREQWQNEQLGQSVSNVQNIVRASDTVNNSNVPEGVQTYANEILEQLLKRQQKLNEEIGISDISIDFKA